MTTAIGMYYMSQQIGIAVGITIMSTLLNGQFEKNLRILLASIPGFEKIIDSILSDSSIVDQLSEQVRLLVRQSYLSSFWVVPAIAILSQAIAIWPLSATTEKYSD
ncbi:hypothetical protein V491_00394 [Pseudogymnoascus sp. VKM F-3775]|nr:hypothetical protein V491_00394 [Pseudogymnoascus sp. VKM F-3775]